jgi:hypothetical protein
MIKWLKEEWKYNRKELLGFSVGCVLVLCFAICCMVSSIYDQIQYNEQDFYVIVSLPNGETIEGYTQGKNIDLGKTTATVNIYGKEYKVSRENIVVIESEELNDATD